MEELKRPDDGWMRAVFVDGLAPRIFLSLAFLAAACLLVLICYVRETRFCQGALTQVETLRCADVARNLARGRGFTSGFITPIELSISPSISRHPSILVPPLPALLLAPLLGIAGGAPANAITIYALAWYCVQLILLVWAADAWFGRSAAVLAGVFYLSNVTLLRFVLVDGAAVISLVPFSLLLLALAWGEARGTAGGLAIGLALGLCYLAVPPYLFLAVPVLCYMAVCRADRRGSTMLAFSAGVLIAAGPWLLRDGIVTGNPFWSMKWSAGLFPERILNTFDQTGVQENWAALWSPRGAAQNLYGVVTVCGNLLGVVFMTSFFTRMRKPGFERIRFLVLACILTVCLMVGGVRFPAGARYYLPFFPFIFLTVACYLDGLFRTGGQRDLKTIAVFAAIIALVLCPFEDLKKRISRYGISRESCDVALSVIPRDAAVVSDIALYIALYGDRKAVMLNYTVQDFLAMRARVGEIAGLHLSADFKGEWIEEGKVEGWDKVWEIAQAGGLPPASPFKNGRLFPSGEVQFYD